MAMSRWTAWVAAGLLARLLMIAVLLMSVRFVLANHTEVELINIDYYKLQSYSYVVASAIIGLAGSVLQIPVALYLLCKSKRMTTSAMILDISMGADMVISLVLTSGVSAGFGATNDVLHYVNGATWKDPAVQKILKDYYGRAIVALILLLVGMLLSICATAVSARLRSKAINDREFDGA
nr:CASP-like protein 4D1 [Lolium perenne]